MEEGVPVPVEEDESQVQILGPPDRGISPRDAVEVLQGAQTLLLPKTLGILHAIDVSNPAIMQQISPIDEEHNSDVILETNLLKYSLE